MRKLFALALLMGTVCHVNAQISWVACTMPTGTLTLLALGPNGELVTMLPTNPSQVSTSVDQGQSWQTAAGTGGPNGIAIFDQILHVTNNGTILTWGNIGPSYSLWRSVDGGSTFSQLSVSAGIPANRFFYGFCSGPNGDVYLYGQGVLRSTDDGQNWTSIVPSITFVTDAVVNASYLFGVHAGQVYRGAIDGTGYWQIGTSGYYINYGLGIARGLNDRIIATGGNDRLITTTDNGDTWTSPTTGLGATPTDLEHVAASPLSDTWVVGIQNSVRSTESAGMPWVTAESGLELAVNEPIQRIFCDANGTFFLYGYFHLYRSNPSTEVPGTISEQAVLDVFPNPAFDRVNLRIEEALIGGSAVIEVFDVTGKLVHTEQLYSLRAIQRLDLPDAWRNGEYVVTVRAQGRESRSARVVVRR